MNPVAFFILVLAVVVLEYWVRWFRPESVDAMASGAKGDLSSSPSGGPREMIVRGVVYPLMITAWGACSIISQHFVYPFNNIYRVGGSGFWGSISGQNAEILGVGVIGLAFFFHFHWYWGLHPKLYNYIDLPKLLALLFSILCLGYAIYRSLLSYG